MVHNLPAHSPFLCGLERLLSFTTLVLVVALLTACGPSSVSDATISPELDEISQDISTPPATITVVTHPPTSGHPGTPTRQVRVGASSEIPSYQCGPAIDAGKIPISMGFMDWFQDGSRILIGDEEIIWVVHINSGEINSIVDANPGGTLHKFRFGYHGDISVTGEHIVYSSCEFSIDVSDEGIAPEERATTYDRPISPVRDPRESVNYEVAIANLGTGGFERISADQRVDHYPVWSPDGKTIAFLSAANQAYPSGAQLRTMSADGSDVRSLVTLDIVPFVPPVWSPDGDYLAVYGVDGGQEDFRYSLYTVRADGSQVWKIGQTTTLGPWRNRLPLPSWSPDSRRIALVAADDDSMEETSGIVKSLVTARPDGSDLQQVIHDSEIRQVEWSPDGSEILYVSDWIYLVRPDGSNRRRLNMPREIEERLQPFTLSRRGDRQQQGDSDDIALVAWSPDGSRIAIHDPGRLLVTMNRDGTHNRIIYQGYLQPRAALPSREAVDSAVCSAGVVVPDPETNPGLVQDCEMLLTAIEVLAGDSMFAWSPDVPITQWEGVVVRGSPLRIVELAIPLRRLSGTIPPELGDLHALEILDLSQNPLIGEIPSELGDLNDLVILRLKSTYLGGAIPLELADLTKLQRLELHSGNFSGIIPPELATLTDLTTLDISDNRLEGCIPSEFSDIWVTGSDLKRCEDGG